MAMNTKKKKTKYSKKIYIILIIEILIIIQNKIILTKINI